MPAGRPTEYKGEETIQRVRDYIATCEDEEYERIKSEGKASTSYDNLVKVNLPSIEGLAVYMKVGRQTIYDWKASHPDFSYILEDVLALQSKRLLENGLSGKYNPTIAKLILTKHGYIERQELTGADGKDLGVVILPRRDTNEDSMETTKKAGGGADTT